MWRAGLRVGWTNWTDALTNNPNQRSKAKRNLSIALLPRGHPGATSPTLGGVCSGLTAALVAPWLIRLVDVGGSLVKTLMMVDE